MKTDAKTVILIVGTVLVAALFQCSFGADCGTNGFACTSCTTLQICVDNVTSGVNLTCPDGTYCSVSSTSYCTADECSDTTTTDATTTDATTTDATTTDATTTDATTATTTTVSNSTAFNCTAEGRFANTSDTTCQSYYFCFLNGTDYTLWEMTCPTTTVFNPTTSLCVANTDYTCTTTTTTAATTTTTAATTTTTAATTTTTAATTTTTAATTTTTAATTTAFSCTAYGRFADTTDSTCQSYYFCYLSGSSYTIMKMTCPTTTVFNPTSSTCVASTAYTCTN